ncbi:cytochrome c oxidase assembly protein COX16 homolog, mitochondrial isoform X1 [Pogona vitticeps]
MPLAIDRLRALKKNKTFKYGLPMLVLAVAGSLAIRELTQVRIDVKKYHTQVQRLQGLMASTTSVEQYARLRVQSLQAWFLSLFQMSSNHPSTLLQVTPELAAHLDWLIQLCKKNIKRR